MAGYNGFSMSNNAVEAYDRGLLPASKAAREFGFKNAAALRACVQSSEWHHTSKEFNTTDFFNVTEAMSGMTWRDLAAWRPYLTKSGWGRIKLAMRAALRGQMVRDEWRCPRKPRTARLMELSAKYPTPYQRRNGLRAVEAAMEGKELTEAAYLAAKAAVDARRMARAANSRGGSK
jgi:hypothetical protein